MSELGREWSSWRLLRQTGAWVPPLGAGVAALGLVSAVLLLVGQWESPPEPVALTAPAPADPRPVAGVLRVSLHGGGALPVGSSSVASAALRHTGVWVNGSYYRGHTSNDLRGFLDGRFKYAWNQVSQSHVRLGRLASPSRTHLGEWELFRNLHRWEGVRLPEGSKVMGASFEVDVELGLDRGLDVLLYQVNKDWIPGHGGVERNNNSRPAAGEVWWNERMRDVEPWGLPGAGFASDTHPEADTPQGALAHARYRPGDSTLTFESMALVDYVEERVARGEPLLFLLKLSDALEDSEGTLIALYSATHGDNKSTARRPRLRLEWVDPAERWQLERRVVLEHGRFLVLPRIASNGATAVSVSFLSEDGYAPPRLTIRGGRGDDVSDWIDAAVPVVGDWEWIELRIDAFVDPIPIGTRFEASLRDTWVPSGPPEEQDVSWVFVSPSGAIHEVRALYAGGHTWEVDFTPDEVGRWVYRWHQHFSDEPYESPVGAFDVVVGDREAGLAALARLTERIEASGLAPGIDRVEAFGAAFTRLQRAFLQVETPETFPLNAGPSARNRAGDLLDAAREALSGMRPPGPRLPLEAGSVNLPVEGGDPDGDSERP